jgi:3-hydroxybutyrate dehydrogenase
MAEPLRGKTTLVTGAAGGIGKKICEKFATLGSFVYLCDIQKSVDLAQAINEKYTDARAAPVACDIADKDDVVSMYRRITEERGGVDILVNNAAVYGPLETHHFPQISYEDFISTIKIDLSGAVYCTLMALPYMKKQQWGKILFSAAPLSSSGIPCPYLAGKAGFIGLTKYIARQYGDYGISTFALVLRHVGTPMIQRVIISRGHDVEEGLAKMNAKSLTGRMITPEEIADIYAHFSVTTSSGINGVTLLSDGGITYLQ